jgi:hypothetical protein
MFELSRESSGLFSLRELRALSGLDSLSLKVQIGRLLEKGYLQRPACAIYALGNVNVELATLARKMDPSCYISGRTVLRDAGVLSQTPSAMWLASRERAGTIETTVGALRFSKLHPALFFGEDPENPTRFLPEKALLDLIHVTTRSRDYGGLAKVPAGNWDFRNLNRDLLEEFAEKFPQAVRNTLAEHVYPRFDIDTEQEAVL